MNYIEDMPDISTPYVYDSNTKSRLKQKSKQSNFSHKSWDDSDIQDIKSDIRNFYRLKQNARCAFCNQQLSLVSAFNCTIEHILPKSDYLEFIFEPKNLCVICADCNQIKRNQEIESEFFKLLKKQNPTLYPRSSNAFLIVHPHFDCFGDHILEINGYYLDKTLKGAHTILVCELNRKLHRLGYENIGFSEVDLMSIIGELMKETDLLKRSKQLEILKKMLILI